MSKGYTPTMSSQSIVRTRPRPFPSTDRNSPIDWECDCATDFDLNAVAVNDEQPSLAIQQGTTIDRLAFQVVDTHGKSISKTTITVVLTVTSRTARYLSHAYRVLTSYERGASAQGSKN